MSESYQDTILDLALLLEQHHAQRLVLEDELIELRALNDKLHLDNDQLRASIADAKARMSYSSAVARHYYGQSATLWEALHQVLTQSGLHGTSALERTMQRVMGSLGISLY
ncbi:hypothetical protein MIND_01132400 [Mycena indigotica]|uniref:Uncharacterized protein n=1 Tax=Mycena indigotica TaxID=2126181 RepID=A0A8H6S5L9_9AGAR|nr:uncharacterized protein MIND_01132400 [Mycena indigotica]KAF7293540.1 hypothetical protein MIND_01132400 [Mycena indigotica]